MYFTVGTKSSVEGCVTALRAATEQTKNPTHSMFTQTVFVSAGCLHLHHGSVVIVVPVEVEVFDADAGGVGAGQQDRGAVHRFD